MSVLVLLLLSKRNFDDDDDDDANFITFSSFSRQPTKYSPGVDHEHRKTTGR